MTSLLCVSISFLLFFLHETHGPPTEKDNNQVPMFHIEFTGTIKKSYTKCVSYANAQYELAEKNAGVTTKLTLYKDRRIWQEVAKKHVDLIGGTYKLEADIPMNGKSGYYMLVAHSTGYYDKDHTFEVKNNDKRSLVDEWNTTLYPETATITIKAKESAYGTQLKRARVRHQCQH
ncbi:hypothetical protein Ddc_19846 [Ditylenchus destructor]|nr:hypothetical protein Ddc_19846 [Ditylenchus destructor]